MENNPYLIDGGKHEDERGELQFVNKFGFENIKRFYVIKHSDQEIVRAWQGHRYETKYFFCLSGGFSIKLLRIDNWTDPSKDLEVIGYSLNEGDVKILVVPPGFANGFKAMSPGSSLLVYSDKTVDESRKDDYRYDMNQWFNWNSL